jgi:hypothetical protein
MLLAQKEGPLPKDLLLAGQLATLRGYASTALNYGERILGDARANSLESLGGAGLVFLNTAPDSPPYARACERLLKIARDEADPASVQALTLLARHRAPTRLTDAQTTPLAIALPEVASDTMNPKEIADRLESNPSARPYHRMLALEVRARGEPSRAKEFVTQAINSFSHGDNETVAALGAWLQSRNQYETVLQVIPPGRAEQRRELFIERIDALAALNRWTELAEMLVSERTPLDQTSQHMYLAVVRSRLGETTASANEWYWALENADKPQMLLALADYAEKHGEPEIANAACARAITKQPGLRSAYIAHLRLIETMGQTAKAHEVAIEIVRLWPDDIATHIHEIYLRLLLGASGVEAKVAEEEAKAFSEHNPWDLGARMTLGLARLKQNQQAAALAAVSEFSPGHAINSAPLAVRAAALAATGWKEKARAEARKLATAKLLPEERALIAPLLEEK